MTSGDPRAPSGDWSALRAQIIQWAERHHLPWRSSLAQAAEEARDNRLDIAWFSLLADGRLQVDFMSGGAGAQKRWIEAAGRLEDLFVQVLKESDDWAGFMAGGPGQGH
jgi:hypothetical protein